MATRTFYLRPSADISLGHTVEPADLGAGYLAINEETNDGAATYLSISGSEPDVEATSSFKMSISNLAKITSVNRVIVAGYASGFNDMMGSARHDITVYVNSTQIQTVRLSPTDGTAYDLLEQEAADVAAEINNHLSTNGSFPDIEIQIYSYADDGGEKNWNPWTRISQIYIQLECEFMPGINIKNNGGWKYSTKAYQKQNGSWVKITENETKTIISSKLVIDKCAFRGHIETSLADIEATCTETGMTGGIKCSYCGKVLKEHDIVVPAEHSYYSHGICRECSTTSPDRFSFTIQRNTQESASTYYSMPNLTWGEWVNNYPTLYGNTIWQITSDGSVRHLYSSTDFIIDGVKSTDLIIADHAYTATDVTAS